MRRQVKPFVTEYRGSARRGKDHPGEQEPQAPRSRSYAEAEKAFHSEAPEDSYEAALRAADALFSVEPRTTADAGAARQRDPSPDFPPRGQRSTEPSTNAAAEDDLAAAVFEGGAREPAGSRRILQAIEPPTEDRFAALEAERAPKRRGRKPGSKNKPKIGVGDDWAAAPLAAPARAVARPAAASAARLPLIERLQAIAEPDMDRPDAVAVDAEAMPPRPRGRNDKFGWKRAGLRPGERWKRRLPKAAW